MAIGVVQEQRIQGSTCPISLFQFFEAEKKNRGRVLQFLRQKWPSGYMSEKL